MVGVGLQAFVRIHTVYNVTDGVGLVIVYSEFEQEPEKELPFLVFGESGIGLRNLLPFRAAGVAAAELCFCTKD